MHHVQRLWESVRGPPVQRTKNGIEYKVTGTANDLEIRYLRPLQYVPHAGLPVYTIMFLGETGSGKTTLMNALCNFIHGVKMEDPFRYDLVNEFEASRYSAAGEKERSPGAKSLTKAVTSYWIPKIDKREIVCGWYQFVDTPGFGDTSGLVKDEENTGRIQEFLKSQDYLHAVCFVANSGLARLTPVQRYIMDKIETLFAKDSIANTFLLATFKDSGPSQLKHTVDAAKFKYNSRENFNFNNCALYTSGPKQIKEDQFLKMYWEICEKGAQLFLTTIEATTPFSLCQTKEVHKLRERLQLCLQKLEEDVEVNLRVVTRIQEKQEDIKTCERTATSTKLLYKLEYVDKKKRREPVPPGRLTTYCNQCVHTCHRDCAYKDDEEKKECIAMDDDGHCKICQKRCAWYKHTNKPYTIEYDLIDVPSEAGMRYKSAIQQKGTAEAAMAILDQQLKDVQNEMESAIDQAHGVLQRLEKIAVSPRLWSLGAYVDYLIEVEYNSGRCRNAEELKRLKKTKLKHHIEEELAKSKAADAHTVVKVAMEEEKRQEQREKKFKSGAV